MRSSYGGLGTRKSADRWSREPRVCVCVREGGRERGNDRGRGRGRERVAMDCVTSHGVWRGQKGPESVPASYKPL